MKPPDRVGHGLEERDEMILAPGVKQFMGEDHFQTARRGIVEELLRENDDRMNHAEQARTGVVGSDAQGNQPAQS